MTFTTNPSTPVEIPPAPARTRQITSTIRTTIFLTDCIAAIYENLIVYNDPNDAPIYARMRPAGCGRRGRWSRKWEGEVVLQAFERTETGAIAALLESLDQHQLPYDREAARAVLVALACSTDNTPWEQRPLGARPHKPRRARHRWWDPALGKRINIYKDTLRMHADPNCTCRYCTTPITKKKTDEKK
jgi:hypothetical protein